MAYRSDLSQPLRGDDSPPRNGMIAIYALIVVFALIGLRFVFDSYYYRMFGAEQALKAGTTSEQLQRNRSEERSRLESAQVSVEEAMAQLAARRFDHPVVQRQASDNLAPLEGWNRLPAFVSTRRFPATAPKQPLTSPTPAPAPAAEALTVEEPPAQ